MDERREEEKWAETRAPEYFCGNYAYSIHKEEIFFLKRQRRASCTWIIWFPVPLLSFKRKAVVGDYSIARRKYNDFAESWKVLVFLSLMQETEENETSFYNIWNFYLSIRWDRFRPSEINELKENRFKTDSKYAIHVRVLQRKVPFVVAVVTEFRENRVPADCRDELITKDKWAYCLWATMTRSARETWKFCVLL